MRTPPMRAQTPRYSAGSSGRRSGASRGMSGISRRLGFWPLRALGLSLIVLVVSPVVAAIRVPDEPLVWTVVPRPGPSVASPRMDETGAGRWDESSAVDLPPVRPAHQPIRPHVALPVIVDRSSQSSGHRESGVASFYCNHDPSRGPISRCTRGHSGGLFAAVRRDLLARLRGHQITVTAEGSGRSVVVTVIDCNCGPDANLIDLYGDAMARLVPLTRGTVSVVVSW